MPVLTIVPKPSGSETIASKPYQVNFLLLQTGDYFLLQTGDKLIIPARFENIWTVAPKAT